MVRMNFIFIFISTSELNLLRKKLVEQKIKNPWPYQLFWCWLSLNSSGQATDVVTFDFKDTNIHCIVCGSTDYQMIFFLVHSLASNDQSLWWYNIWMDCGYTLGIDRHKRQGDITLSFEFICYKMVNCFRVPLAMSWLFTSVLVTLLQQWHCALSRTMAPKELIDLFLWKNVMSSV